MSIVVIKGIAKNNKELDEIREFCKKHNLDFKQIYFTDREEIKPIEFTDKKVPKYGTLLTMEEFIDSCRCGAFIDYDGYGYYATATMETNIIVRPMHYHEDRLRKEFTHVMWYNR